MEQNDINKLDVVYGQIYEVSIMIGQLIDRKQYYNLDNFLTVKEQLYTEGHGAHAPLVHAFDVLTEREGLASVLRDRDA